MDTIACGYFDGAEVELLTSPDTGADRAALDNFLELTAEDRLRDSRHVYAYYKDFHDAVGGEDWLDEEMGIPAAPEDIWQHVTPGPITIEQAREHDPCVYVTMEAECAWEIEHGLLLVWREGKLLTKAGGYDGHTTNVRAFADDSLEDVVYAASNPAFTTRLNEA